MNRNLDCFGVLWPANWARLDHLTWQIRQALSIIPPSLRSIAPVAMACLTMPNVYAIRTKECAHLLTRPHMDQTPRIAGSLHVSKFVLSSYFSPRY